jgi:hypothetical protein
MDTFRTKLAERIIAKPDLLSASADFTPHVDLVRIADALRNGESLKEIAIRAWALQDGVDLPVHVAARFRTIYRRIMRQMALTAGGAA